MTFNSDLATFEGVEKLPASLVIITFNEEKNIERCIKSASWCDDVVVVDSGSTDQTVTLAQKLGARTVVEKWRGYGPQKNLAVSLAKNDWVIFLDADEALSPELSRTLASAIANKALDKDAYLMPRLSFYMGRYIRHGGWYPDRQVRLFHRGRGKWSDDHLHERMMVERLGSFSEPILHWPFVNLQHQVNKNNSYSTLGALNLQDSGETFSFLKFIFKPWVKFLECYFFKRGFLDGMPGLIIAIGAAYSVHLRWSKLWEMQKLGSQYKT